MKLFQFLATPFTVLMLVSCVTINIYFPAAAAEKAADKIIEDVWGAEQPQAEETSQPEQQSKAGEMPIVIQLLSWMSTPAQAAEANLNISSPAINGLQAQMKQRHAQLKTFYDSGAVGLTDQGLITVRDAKAIPLKDRNKVKTLVAQENADRSALYTEIARANGHPEWQADIQATFAKRWIEKAAKGWWYNSGGWKQK